MLLGDRGKWIIIIILAALTWAAVALGIFYGRQVLTLTQTNTELEGRIAQLGDELTEMEGQLAEMEGQLAEMESQLQLNDDIIADYQVEVASLKEELTYWKDRPRYVIPDSSGYREFESVNELKEWLKEDPVSEHKAHPIFYDCDDYALDLVMNALEDGYWIGLAANDTHMFNWTIIGNDIYRIEARDDTFTYWSYID